MQFSNIQNIFKSINIRFNEQSERLGELTKSANSIRNWISNRKKPEETRDYIMKVVLICCFKYYIHYLPAHSKVSILTILYTVQYFVMPVNCIVFCSKGSDGQTQFQKGLIQRVCISHSPRSNITEFWKLLAIGVDQSYLAPRRWD